MSKLTETRDKLQASLGNREKQLAVAQRAYKANRKRAYQFHNRQVHAGKLADRERRTYEYYGTKREKRALHYDREFNRYKVVAYNNHVRAEEELGKVKRLTQKIHGLHVDLNEVLDRLGKVTIVGNKAVGGSDYDRWMAVLLASVANCSSSTRRNFYSQIGAWDIDHPIIPGPEWGHRDDCSSTITAWALAAGLPDPNGEDWHGGFTGTLVRGVNGWKEVSLDRYLSTDAPGYVVYGSGTGHHTEGKCPSPSDRYRTAGHGSAPVDFGTTHLFGSGEVERYFLYLANG